ncbi:MAG: alpha/beta hydrolase [Fluviicola sp.]|nr:alpha/beta hydrolase [Fluviicola sp.]
MFRSDSIFKKTVFLMMVLLFVSACKKKNTQPEYDVSKSYTLTNVSYDTDAKQKMDVYLPANRSSASTKVFVLIHGGAWSAGDKNDLTSFFNNLRSLYPNHAIININYRLASESSPAYTKQINDIQKALSEINKTSVYNVSDDYMFIGMSAGAHLSLLYAYAFDPNHHVKGVINTVGPVDFMDPNYMNNPLYWGFYTTLMGTNPTTALIQEVSPAHQVTASSPPTISFYGNNDPLIPSTQMNLLHSKLNDFGVYNQSTMYNAGHGNWNSVDAVDYVNKMMTFINAYFPE